MALFRRGTRTAEEGSTPQGSTPDETVVGQVAASTGGERAHGPWDVADVDGIDRRIDLGALWLPPHPGMQLRMEIDKVAKRVTSAALVLDGSTLQVQAFAAPRTEGIWDEIRAELGDSVTKQGGSVDDLPGPFGRELLARMPVRTDDGRTAHRAVRFIGVDGPRWFLRGVLGGKAAVDPAAATTLEQIFGGIVVVRGSEARAPRDLLTLALPESASAKAAETLEPAPTPDFDPLTRGPEITEIR